MKKLLTVLVVALATATLAHAQFGIVAGYTSSATNAKAAVEEVQSAHLWHAGVAYKLNFGALALQPSLTYSMKGTTVDNLQYKSGYLELSAGVQLGLDLMIARPFVVAEPFIGYQVYGNETWDQQGYQNMVNKLEYGFGIGIGCDVLSMLQLRVEWYKNLGALAGANGGAVEETLKNGNYQGIKITAGFFF